MDRSSKGHMDETVNLKSFYLRLLQKIWIVPLAAVIGAVIAIIIYTLATVTFGPGKEYRAEATMYISFAYDENKGTLVDYYNAYTWDKQLKATDDILNVIIDELGEDQILSTDELLQSISLDIPADVRVMQITATTKDSDLSEKILKATVKSMEHYGEINGAFDSIKLLGEKNAKLVTYTDRTLVAAVFGAICAAVLTILALLLADALDDAVYVPEDAEKRYNLPVLGILMGTRNDFFRNELLASFDKKVFGASEVIVISTDSVKNDEKSVMDTKRLEEELGEALIKAGTKLTPMAVPGSVLDNYRKIGTCDGVVICIPYGVRRGAITSHVLGQLKKHECPVLGIVLVRSSRWFMRRYYNV